MTTKSKKAPAPGPDRALILPRAVEAARGYAEAQRTATLAAVFGDEAEAQRQGLRDMFKALKAKDALGRQTLDALGAAWAGADAALSPGFLGGWVDPDSFATVPPAHIQALAEGEGPTWAGVHQGLPPEARHGYKLMGLAPIGSQAEAGMRKAACAPQDLAGWPRWAEPLLVPTVVIAPDGEAFALGLALWAKVNPGQGQAPALAARSGMDPARAYPWSSEAWCWQA